MAVATPPRPDAERTRRPRAPATDRRRVPAGHALVVMLLALVLAAVLNAKGMHKTAAEQPEGVPRDVALALTGALSAVTGALQVDEPRKVLQAALGRAGDDDVDTNVTFTRRTPARRRAAAARTQPKPVFSAARPMRLYITGDSLVGDPGTVVENRAIQRPDIKVVGPGVDDHAATGLAQPGVFNWFTYLPAQVRALKPDLVVLGFGGNDGQSLFGTGGGQQYGTPEWETEYRRRVGGVMDEVTGRGARLVWVGLPIPRDPDLAQKFRFMNAIYASEAAKRRGLVAFVDNYDRFAKDGQYADYLRDDAGKLVKVRAADGVHYDIGGANIVADEIERVLPQLVRLR